MSRVELYLATNKANPIIKPNTVFHLLENISMVHTIATVKTAMADTPGKKL